MKSATFFEALASAAKRPGERWREHHVGMHVGMPRWFYFEKGYLMGRSKRMFDVHQSDLTATWVCETEE